MEINFSLYFDVRAIGDIQSASEYYHAISPKVKSKFEKELQNQLQILEQNPYSKALKYHNIRVAHLGKFPFSVHFRINEPENRVEVLAVFYQRQNPENWPS